MPLPTTGPLSIINIVDEFGGEVPHGLNEFHGIVESVPAVGTIAISNFYGTTAAIIPGDADWTRAPALVVVDNPEVIQSAGDRFGYSVAIHGEIAVVGAIYNSLDQSNSGRAYVINADTSAVIHTLINPNIYSSRSSDHFGWSVDVSETHVIVGAPYEDSSLSNGSGQGAAYIFNLETGALVHSLQYQQYNLQTNDNFGHSVAIDGNYAVIGAPNEDQNSQAQYDNGGAVYVYDVTTGTMIYNMQSSEWNTVSNFGHSVDISGDYAIIGAPVDTNNQTTGGRAYLLHIPTNTRVTLNNPTSPVTHDRFGISVAISGDYAVVGAYYKDISGTNTGQAYIFNATTGALVGTLNNPNAYGTRDHDYFGMAVAISENYINVSTGSEDSLTGPWMQTGGSESGAAYIFAINNDEGNITFPLVQTLKNPNAYGTSANDNFGTAVAMYENRVIVGAWAEDDTDAAESGKAYIFDSFADDATSTPTLANVSILSNNEDTTRAVENNVITIAFEADKIIDTPVVTFYSGGAAIAGSVTYENTSIYNNTWTAKYTVSSLDTTGDVSYSIAFVDSFGNVGVPVTAGSGSVTLALTPDWNTAAPSLITIDNPEVIQSVGDRFGYSVAIHREFAVVGAIYNSLDQSNSGRAYVINADTSAVIHTLINPNIYSSRSSDHFGWSVDVSETHVIVGAPYEDSVASYGSGQGAAYIFDKSTGALVHQLQKGQYNYQINDNFGASVAIDGNYAVIGAPNEDQNSQAQYDNGGSVYIYDVTTGTMIRNIQSSEWNTVSNFGQSVDISGDYAIIGAPVDTNNQTTGGRAYLLHIPTNTRVTLNNPTSPVTHDRFGISVAISGDYAVVGAYYKDVSGTNTGQAYVYKVSTGSLLYHLDNPNAYGTRDHDYFGMAVAISDNKIIVSTGSEDSLTGPWMQTGGSESGAAYIFAINNDEGNITFPLVQTLKNPNAYGTSANDNFGTAVAMYENRVIVGAWAEDDTDAAESGKAYIFDSFADDATSTPTLANVSILSNNEDTTRAVENNVITIAFEADKIIDTPVVTFYSGGAAIAGSVTYENTSIYNNTWTAKYTVSSLDTTGDVSYSIAFVDSFGNVGVPVTAGSGSVTLALTPDWNTAAPSLITIDNPEVIQSVGDRFGYSVAIHREFAVVGAIYNSLDQSNSGRAYVINADTSAVIHTLINPNIYSSRSSDHFGWSVDVSETHVIVGAPYEDSVASYGSGQGAAYIFDKSTGALVHQLQKGQYNYQINDNFGASVAIDGNYAVIGAPNEDQNPQDVYDNGGAVYIYDVTTGTMIYNMQSSEWNTVSNFGHSVDISGDYVIIGAPVDTNNQTTGGRAYLLHIPTNTRVTLNNPTSPVTHDRFGISVAISGDYAVVGAYYKDVSGTNTGQAYVYKVSTGSLLYHLDNPNAYGTRDHDYFGMAVAISDNKIIVGTGSEDSLTGPWMQTGGSASGAAYIFDAQTGALERTIENPNAYGTSANDNFGTAVAMYENRVIVGAWAEDDTDAAESGKAYIFDSFADDATSTPTLANVSILSNNEDTTRAVENNVITIAFEADKIIDTPVVTFYSGGAAIAGSVTYENTSIYNNTWTAKYTVSSLDTTGDVSYSIAFVDSFGNVGVPVTAGSGSVTRAITPDWNTAAPSLITVHNPEVISPESDRFGISVAIHGDTAVVGASNNSLDQTNSGRAYVINADTSAILHTLINPNMYSSPSSDHFGMAVDVSETHVIVGAPYEDSVASFGSGQGAAYIFDKSTGALVHSLQKGQYNSQINDNFGASVAIDGNYAVIGAPNEDQNSQDVYDNGGAVYIYDVTTGTMIYNIQSSEWNTVSNLGHSVDISGDYAIFGAPVDTNNQTTGGRVYLHHIPTNTRLTLNNPTSPVTHDRFGYSVAISGDYAVVGAYYKDVSGTNTGQAYVYKVSTGSLLYHLDNPNAYGTRDHDYFGMAVAISDNKIIVSTGSEDSLTGPWMQTGGSESGAAYIFAINNDEGNITFPLVQTLKNPNAYGTSANDNFGTAVAMYENRVIVGAWAEDDTDAAESGKAYIFDSFADDATSTPTLANVSILSNNEDTTRAVENNVITIAFEADKIIDTPVVTFYSGGAAIAGSVTYENTSIYNNTWTAKYTVSSLDTTGDVSYSIAFVDSFGNVGVPVTAGSGSVTLALTPDWNTAAPSLITIDNPEVIQSVGDRFGYSVAIHREFAVVGAIYNSLDQSNSGRAYVINADTSAVIHTLINPNIYSSRSSDHFGWSVDVSETHVIVGAPYEDSVASYGSGQGAAYIFDKSTGALVHSLQKGQYNSQTNDNFGHSVAIDGNYAVIGAKNEDQNPASQYDNGGAVYIYDVTTGTMIRNIQGPEYSTVSNFGQSVDISGDYAIIGAPVDTNNQTTGGRAYIYHIPTNTRLTLNNPSPVAGDQFGVDVAISGDYAVVGARYVETPGTTNSGRVYVYKVSTGSLLYYIDNPNTYGSTAGDYFGTAVAISDNKIIVSAPEEHDADGYLSGAAYIFDAQTGALESTIHNPNAYGTSGYDRFGMAVAMYKNRAIVGALYEDDIDAADSGKAYIFDAS